MEIPRYDLWPPSEHDDWARVAELGTSPQGTLLVTVEINPGQMPNVP
ncbi:MAG TPA: hypothetical protein VF952_01510 [Chloroflexia bacterium]